MKEHFWVLVGYPPPPYPKPSPNPSLTLTLGFALEGVEGGGGTRISTDRIFREVPFPRYTKSVKFRSQSRETASKRNTIPSRVASVLENPEKPWNFEAVLENPGKSCNLGIN